MDKVTVTSLDELYTIVQEMEEGEIIRIVFEEADNGEGHDS